jgi:hypothetical protein
VSDIRTQFGLKVVTAETRKESFIAFVEAMDMTTSYKPVLLLALLRLADAKGRVNVAELVTEFQQFYMNRLVQGMPVEKPRSRMSQIAEMSDTEVERLLFAMPFERFERRNYCVRCKDVAYVAFVPEIWRRLTDNEKAHLHTVAERNIAEYFAKLEDVRG